MIAPKRIATKSAVPVLPISSCLAKSYRHPDGQMTAGRDIFNHCQIVGYVARALIQTFPLAIQKKWFRSGAALVAACHDIGKVSPTFQKKIYTSLTQNNQHILQQFAHIDSTQEKNWGGHAGTSYIAANALNAGAYIAEILGQHHGFSPQTGIRCAKDDCFGGNPWQQHRAQLVAQLMAELSETWPSVANDLEARVFAGLTSVADWIGSGSDFEDPSQPWRAHISDAIKNAGFAHVTYQQGLSFEDIFCFPPHHTQKALFTNCTVPGVYILEAPMGLGKTEAALYAAYQLLSHGHATGLYFALPTQLTSDRIHNRVNAFLNRILAPDSPHKQALLLHGNAWLKETEMGEEGAPGGSWFNQGKRGILAPFAVGTIDQALMSVMNVKHGFVRTFGLLGKVVILDEVHSYDSYTGTLLDELVATLRKLDCTVIILSATLTQERRAALLGNNGVQSCSYPLVSAMCAAHPLQEISVPPPLLTPIQLHLTQQIDEAISEAVCRAGQGQQVLWIENTVAEAQDIYKIFASQCAQSIRVGIIHSRFTRKDRAHTESEWVDILGKNGGEARGAHGRIIVGTQVLEQSLDIDADFLISRFCPTDMLLQRLGRLWRHKTTIRPPQAQRQAFVLVPSLESAIENPEKAFGKTAFVYSPYVLCRALEVWHQKTQITLPTDIRATLEATYESRQEHTFMAKWQYELEEGTSRTKGRKALKQLANLSLSRGGKTRKDSEATTRYSTQETVEVLLLQKIEPQTAGTLVTLLDGSELLLPKFKQKDKRRTKHIAATLLQNCLPVPIQHAPNTQKIQSLAWLKPYMFLGHDPEEDSLVRVAIVHEDTSLRATNGTPANTKHSLSYSNLGYCVHKKS
jgi:CRISPR-associated endonuclease/helicase Cas3